jgi:hypothetical protein
MDVKERPFFDLIGFAGKCAVLNSHGLADSLTMNHFSAEISMPTDDVKTCKQPILAHAHDKSRVSREEC